MKPITEKPIEMGRYEPIRAFHDAERTASMAAQMLATIEHLNIRIRSLETKCAELDRRMLENEVRTNLCREEVRSK